MTMATIERKVCDIDQREEGVVTVSIRVNGRGGDLDLCDRCLNSVSVSTAADKTRRTSKNRRQDFTKIELPPQPY